METGERNPVEFAIAKATERGRARVEWHRRVASKVALCMNIATLLLGLAAGYIALTKY